MLTETTATSVERRNLAIPSALAELMRPHRYKVISHGRGAGGSWTIARLLLLRGLDGRQVILCCREIQRTIRDSVHALLRRQIELLNLENAYTVTDNEIRGPGSTRFIFRGLRSDPAEIKSMEGITVAWVGEAQAVSQQSWDVLIHTVREPGSEIWVDFNPASPDDATYRLFVDHRQPDEWYTHITYHDNPWFPSELERERQHLLETNRPKHDHIYGGVPLILTEARVFTPDQKNYFSLDQFREWVSENSATDHFRPTPGSRLAYRVPQARCDVRLTAGLDYGYEDANAFAIVAYSLDPKYPEHWLLWEEKIWHVGVKPVADMVRRGELAVEMMAAEAGVINRHIDICSDFGGGGKQIAAELAMQYGIACFTPAVKTAREFALNVLRDEVAEGVFRLKAGGPLDEEMGRIVWQRDEQERIIREIDDNIYHPDALWATIYALRPVWMRRKAA